MQKLVVRDFVQHLVLVEKENVLKLYQSFCIILLVDIGRVTELLDDPWQDAGAKFYTLLCLQSMPALFQELFGVLRT